MNIMPKRILSCILCATLIFTTAYAAEVTSLEVSAPSAILMEADTGKILFEKNAHEMRPPASVTKIMTILLTMEAIDSGKIKYDDMVIGSARAKSMGGSTIFLDEGEALSVRDILKGMAVASGNDACVAMAEHLAGSVEEFVALMNKRAKELGMNETNFITCNGLDADGHQMSAYDIALMSRELLKHEDVFQFTTIWMDSLRDGKFTLSNTNKLIRFYKGATGLKTGSTSVAKNCISATAKRDGMHLIAVVMGAETSKKRFADASNMLNYGFGAYGVKKVVEKGKPMSEANVKKGMKSKTELVAENDFTYLFKRSEKTEVLPKINAEKDFDAPVEKGKVGGNVEIVSNGKKIGEVNLVFKEDIPKKSVYAVYLSLLESIMKI